MTFADDRSHSGIWLASFAIAIAAHAGLLFLGLMSLSEQAPPERKATEINVSAMSLETPKANAGAAAKGVADRAKAQAAQTVESLSAQAAETENVAAIEDTTRAETARSDRAEAAQADVADAANERPTAEKSESANTQQAAKAQNLETTRTATATPTKPAENRIVGQPLRAETPTPRPSSTAANVARPKTTAVTTAPTTVVTALPKPTALSPTPKVESAPSTAVVRTEPVIKTVTANPEPTPQTSVTPTTPAVSASEKPAPSVSTGTTVTASRVTGTSPTATTLAPVPEIVPEVVETVVEVETTTPVTSGEVATGETDNFTTEQSAALYRDLLKSISDYDGGECFAALPELDSDGKVSLRSFARTMREVNLFSDTLAAEVGTSPPTELRAISNVQCAALEFARLSPNYPQFQIYLELDETDIQGTASGNLVEFVLAGYVGNAGRGHRYLLVVDDKGLVQDLSSFMSPGLSRLGFNVTLTFKGDRVQTEQLIIAIQSETELTSVRGFSGRPAEAFFERLSFETVLTGAVVDLAIAGFIVR